MTAASRAARYLAGAVAMLSWPVLASGADLKPETVQAWDEYVKAARLGNPRVPGSPFLWSDAISGQRARLRSGEIVVSPAGAHVPLKVPSGLIHDWIGAAFIPSATLSSVLPVVRDYARYKEFYHPHVADSKPIATGDFQDQFSMLLMHKSVIARTALDSDYRSSFTPVDDRRWYSITETTRIQEIADYGTPSEHTLPEDRGTGLIWRLYSVARFEERDGGVYVEVEAVALSRDIPGSLRWMVDPIVRRVSRSSLATSLRQTQDAVRSGARSVSVSPGRAPDPGPIHSFR